MLLRTSKQDGNLWPVSHHVTVRPVASKVHPTDNLARDPNDTRKKHRPQKTSCAASQGGPVGFRKAGKKWENPSHFRNTCSEQWRVSDAIEAKNAELQGKRMRSMKKQEKANFGPPASSEHFSKIPKLRKTKSLQFKVTGDVVSKLIWNAHQQKKNSWICRLKNANDHFQTANYLLWIIAEYVFWK